jgi:hypothetical protein
MSRLGVLTIVFVMVCAACTSSPDDSDLQVPDRTDEFLGRWDVTISTEEGDRGTWFEVSRENGQVTGRFVGQMGSVRPIETLEIVGDELSFSLPTQYESHPEDMKFIGKLGDRQIEGITNSPEGTEWAWIAVPAPSLARESEPEWGEQIQLFNGSNLDGWYFQNPDAPETWEVQDGVLVNKDRGSDLVTEAEFQDFKLHLEFKYPEGSNSGVYLRGRYELQIQDDYGKEPGSRLIGGIYGFLTPSVNAAKKAGEWQTYDITLIGRDVTVVLNGETILDGQEIPGITGEALDSNEGEPGPIMLQGTHGPISFRTVHLTPAK